jgi:putative FmdB family regulatory protein
MPVYEYFCRACGKPFVETMHVEEHERDVPPCPECRKKEDVEKRMSSFTAVTKRKSASF